MDDLLDDFRVYGLAAGHSQRTITAREQTIGRLARDLDLTTATQNQLTSWLAALVAADGRPLARSSRATYRAHLAAFYGWMQDTEHRTDNPAMKLPKPRVPRAVPHPVTPDEVTRILAACSDPRARMTRAYVLLAAYEGLRVHEVAKVRGEDIAHGEIRIHGKGGTDSTVPLHPSVELLASRMPARGWWFPTTAERAGHVSRVSVSQAIKRAMVRAGVNGTPHSLRHHFGTQVLRATGGDLRTTQRALRHASPATTAIYTQVADDRLRSAVNGIPM
ncbi:tyrosine-type recombinase/integrase [Flexivirga oryzae]|uniref:Site-specific recombinase XerD n=1 Tax=Flexivirga oryzae TaxID=1794944 RepID=A0A839NIT7_9MICO|nr:tyrosine-type recombinase/integrase [Flexivirga oryzae]MBB2894561.1 site-specific recombinase XerD [Flexivirga oryzae]